MFEGMDFGMYGIDPNLLQKQMDLQNFQKEAASHAMMQQGNPAAVGAGIAAAAGTLLGKNLQRLTGIRDPEVEKVAQAQKAAEIMKGIEGDTPSEYYSNASEAMKEFSPSLAASL